MATSVAIFEKYSSHADLGLKLGRIICYDEKDVMRKFGANCLSIFMSVLIRVKGFLAIKEHFGIWKRGPGRLEPEIS